VITTQRRAPLPPVLDLEGRPVRVVRVNRNEQTCLDCGETTTEDYCPTCSDFSEGLVVRHLVPTISYLRDDEYIFNS